MLQPFKEMVNGNLLDFKGMTAAPFALVRLRIFWLVKCSMALSD
jgi:hypothetical protein